MPTPPSQSAGRRGAASRRARTPPACRRTRPAPGEPLVADRPGTRSRRTGASPRSAPPRSTKPLVGGDPLEPVGRRRGERRDGGREADGERERERERGPRARSRRRTGPRAGATPSATSVGPRGEHGAHRRHGDHRLADADQRVHAEHRRQHRAERHRAGERRARRSSPPRRSSPRATRRRRRGRGRPSGPGAARARAPTARRRRAAAPSTPMLRTLAPSAVTPPSAKANACTASTTAIARQASHGPSRTAASVAPRKCPLVPPATGKLSICAAKMNAASTPSSGTRDSSRSPSAARSAQDRRRRWPHGRDGGDAPVEEPVRYVQAERHDRTSLSLTPAVATLCLLRGTCNSCGQDAGLPVRDAAVVGGHALRERARAGPPPPVARPSASSRIRFWKTPPDSTTASSVPGRDAARATAVAVASATAAWKRAATHCGGRARGDVGGDGAASSGRASRTTSGAEVEPVGPGPGDGARRPPPRARSPPAPRRCSACGRRTSAATASNRRPILVVSGATAMPARASERPVPALAAVDASARRRRRRPPASSHAQPSATARARRAAPPGRRTGQQVAGALEAAQVADEDLAAPDRPVRCRSPVPS